MTPCREWQGAKIKGYGNRRINGKGVLVHRWVVAQIHGWEAIEGREVIHLCDNPSCYRYDHLRIGTHAENMNDMKIKGRASIQAGVDHPQHRLTEEQVLDIFSNRAESNSQTAKRYGVSTSAVAHIRTGRRWSHITHKGAREHMSNDGINLDDLQGGGKSWGGEGFGIGDKVTGEVVKAERIQQSDFQSGEPLFWSNGDPRMMSRVTIKTNLTDSDDDDGQRAIYLKGGRFEVKEGSGMSGESALAEAMKAAGSKTIEPGGQLAVAITGLGKASTRGFQPPKLWTIQYKPPVASISADDLFADG